MLEEWNIGMVKKCLEYRAFNGWNAVAGKPTPPIPAPLRRRGF